MKMVPYEAFVCSYEKGDVVLRESYKPSSRDKLYYACPKSKPLKKFRCGCFLWKEERLRQLMSSSGAPSTASYSIGPLTTPIYSPGASTPQIYSSRPSTPLNYSPGSSRNLIRLHYFMKFSMKWEDLIWSSLSFRTEEKMVFIGILSFNNGPVYMRWMYPSVQGIRTNVASQYSRVSNTSYMNGAAATKHKELLDALSSQESGENVPEKEVMEKVLDKSPVVGKEDEEYEESDDEEMEVLDEHEEINDGDDYVE
ncbi:hypothetical protein Tco_1546664 [Tanacetum coccineum]